MGTTIFIKCSIDAPLSAPLMRYFWDNERPQQTIVRVLMKGE
jgi:hypothetical protein